MINERYHALIVKDKVDFMGLKSCFPIDLSLLLMMFLLFILCPSTVTASNQDNYYLIGPEDVLEISIWKDPDLTKQVIVRPDGRISFPLVGEVEVGGHSVEWLQKHITERIHEYVPDAVVTVMVIQVNTIKIYVVGKVARPGEYRIGKKINIMQALALAGGLAPFADDDDILVLRYLGGKQVKIPFDYSRVKKGKAIEQNIWLNNGDVVVVP